MCWACEEQDLWLRYQLELAVARGVIPEGFEPADFEAFGLPVPGQAVPAASDAAPPAAKASPTLSAKPSARAADAFFCDRADGE